MSATFWLPVRIVGLLRNPIVVAPGTSFWKAVLQPLHHDFAVVVSATGQNTTGLLHACDDA